MRPQNSIEVIFQIIRKYGPLSNGAIANRAGVVKSTVSSAVAKLIEWNIAEEEPSLSKRKRIQVAENYGSVVGIYMGLTSIHIGLCDAQANILELAEYDINMDSQKPDDIIGLIIQSIESFETGFLLGIGIGVPGPVQFSEKILYAPPEMPGWDKYPICTLLQERFHCPVILDNDVNVLALGERDKGLARDVPHFLYVKVGTGIGCGIVADRALYRGANGAAGDIGHIAVEGNTTLCPCGNQGCLEIVAASRGIVKEALASRTESPHLSSFAPENITALQVIEGVRLGDTACTRIIIRSGYIIGSVLAKLVNFFNPSLIVVGGGVSQSGQKFISSIQEVLYQRSTPLATSILEVQRSELQDQAGVMGAAILALDEVFQSVQEIDSRKGRK